MSRMVASLCLVVLIGALCCFQDVSSQEEGGKYTNKYDNVDLDSILQNDRLYKNYFNCLIGEGKCAPEGLEIKKNLKEAFTSDCAKCTDKQKDYITRVSKFLKENKPDDWKVLEKIYGN
uniref:Chemosensory protein 14 n=1 Tax=Yemma signatus TaxID=300820 RepID=A0A3G2GRR7_9HEMI|nr:chemosensory protein 14 [Yemma signatus]